MPAMSQASKHIPAFTEPVPPPTLVPVLSSHLDLLPSSTIILCSQEDPCFLLAPHSAPLCAKSPHLHQLVTAVCATTPPPMVPDHPSSLKVTEDEDGSASDTSSESSLTSLESSSNKIPKPDREAGRPGRGSYNLEAQLAWDKAVILKLKVSSSQPQ